LTGRDSLTVDDEERIQPVQGDGVEVEQADPPSPLACAPW
jgi:hypothetical protein